MCMFWRSLFVDIRILITPLVSCGHCIVCPSSAYGFWLSFGILWPLCCLSFGLRLLITPLVSWPLCCLFFFDLRILMTPVVSSSSSYKVLNYNTINWKITILSEQFQHSNRKIVVKGKIVTLNIHIHNRSLSWQTALGTGTSLNSGGVKLVLWTQA
jgi:hypothetical protein